MLDTLFIMPYKFVLTFKSVRETLLCEHVVQFITLFKVVLTLSMYMKPYCVAIQMKAIEQYLHVVLFIMLYNNNNSIISTKTIVFLNIEMSRITF